MLCNEDGWDGLSPRGGDLLWVRWMLVGKSLTCGELPQRADEEVGTGGGGLRSGCRDPRS